MLNLFVVSFILALCGTPTTACRECEFAGTENVVETIERLPGDVFRILPLAGERVSKTSDHDELLRAMAHAFKEDMKEMNWSEVNTDEVQDLYWDKIYEPCIHIMRIVQGHYHLDQAPQATERVKSMKKMAEYCDIFHYLEDDLLINVLQKAE